MILLIHGGPNGQDSHIFDFLRQWLATKGYAELGGQLPRQLRPRQDNSKSHRCRLGPLRSRRPPGRVDRAVSLGVADPNGLAVAGWSYGGILTDSTVASTDRFKAAISGAGSRLSPSPSTASTSTSLQYDKNSARHGRTLRLYVK